MSLRLYLFIFLIVVFGFAIISVFQYGRWFDRRVHVVFCDVGQGDATFIRTPGGKDILIDGGPDSSVLNCLSSNMPFWDRTIDLVLLTHPHQDHFVGLFDVFERYTVASFATENLTNTTQGYSQIRQKVKDEGISWQTVHAGDRFKTAHSFSLNVLGPSKDYLLHTSPGGTIGERGEFASLILQISYGSFDVLITGDSQVSGIRDGLSRQTSGDIEVLQVPHHGSKTGIDQNILKLIHPEIAVISVGRKNRYGHPADYTVKILRDNNVKIIRTDQRGYIEVISDGQEWVIKTGGG